MEETLHDKILSSLEKVTEEQVLIITCATPAERWAIFRLVTGKEFRSEAIHYYDRKFNYIHLDSGGFSYFSKMTWYKCYTCDRGCGVSYSYVTDEEGTEKRITYDDEDTSSNATDDDIKGLGYNAVAIYPKKMGWLDFKDNYSFIKLKDDTNTKGPDIYDFILDEYGHVDIDTDEQERDIINNIVNPELIYAKLSDILTV